MDVAVVAVVRVIGPVPVGRFARAHQFLTVGVEGNPGRARAGADAEVHPAGGAARADLDGEGRHVPLAAEFSLQLGLVRGGGVGLGRRGAGSVFSGRIVVGSGRAADVGFRLGG